MLGMQSRRSILRNLLEKLEEKVNERTYNCERTSQGLSIVRRLSTGNWESNYGTKLPNPEPFQGD